LRSALQAQRVLGLPVDSLRLSLPDDGPGYLGDRLAWDEAAVALRAAAASVDLSSYGLDLVEAEGEAAFYGPKLDLQLRDGNGQEAGSPRSIEGAKRGPREVSEERSGGELRGVTERGRTSWGTGETIATVQLDFVQPERFDLRYAAADGSEPHVVMIHRGTVGSMERVTAALIERYDGRMPLWLNPIQLRVLPVSQSADAVAREFVDALVGRGLRAVQETDGSLGARTRRSRARRDYAFAVIGEREVADGSVQLTDVFRGWRGSLPRDGALAILAEAYAGRAAPVWPGEPRRE
jgi:threonyl-tRNA synthetase